MANKNLFKSARPVVAPANTTNNAGGIAYTTNAKNSLARFAVVGTLGNTFYATANTQLDQINNLIQQVDPIYIAKLAIYSRNKGLMKDMPALLLAHYVIRSADSPDIIQSVFNRVITNGKMLKNFVQIMRSGQLGRKSLGSRSKRLVQNWLVNREPEALFKDSIGNDPSLRDVFMLSHPKPKNKAQEALFKYLIDGTYSSKLPKVIRDYENWKQEGGVPPAVPIEMLTCKQLSQNDWNSIVPTMSWNSLRMNLNTLERNGLFNNPRSTLLVSERLGDPAQLPKFLMPYQIYTAYLHGKNLPNDVKQALVDAPEHATHNVTLFDSGVSVLLDVSDSMRLPVTGSRDTKDTVMRNIDVASLFTSVFVNNNVHTNIFAFNDSTQSVRLESKNSVATNTQYLSSLLRGGTNCGQALAYLNNNKIKDEIVVIISDNESWISSKKNANRWAQFWATDAMGEWEKYRKRVPNAKLVCLDISPNPTSQFVEREDILNMGGFSDNVFDIITMFASETLTSFEAEVEKVKI